MDLFDPSRAVSFRTDGLSIDGADWNRDLSPWPAPKAFKSGGDFGGGADALIEKIGRIVPLCEEVTGPQELRAFAGYSLGGLFALYCIYKTELFCSAASVSGSSSSAATACTALQILSSSAGALCSAKISL